MNKVSLMVGVLGLSVLSANAFAEPVINSFEENRLVQVCEAIQSDSKLRLNHVMVKNKLTYDEIAEGLKCNGKDPVTFARSVEAENNARFVEHQIHAD